MDKATAGAVPAVAVRSITKRFPGVLANDSVDFEAREGEVHALLGENGAGKSTLASILAGLYRPDAGEIEIYGSRVEFHSPRDAMAAGVSMVHQHFRLAASLTVADNIVLGHAGTPWLRTNPTKIDSQVAELAKRYRMPVNPRARIWQLSVGEQQRVEILKSLYRGARILILDEPTSLLTPQEADDLFGTRPGPDSKPLSVAAFHHSDGAACCLTPSSKAFRTSGFFHSMIAWLRSFCTYF